jgi:molybdate transport system substrate-binding protein
MSRRRTAGAAGSLGAAVLLALLSGCGGEQSQAAEEAELTVSAASSLTEAFEAYADETASEERFSFAGSDDLAAQIRQGAVPDVYAAADTELPEALHDEGLVEEPVVFAVNRMVLAVPEGGSGIETVQDLAEPGVDLVLGAEGVPFGSYAREVLDRLPAAQREAILANVRSQEPDVKAAVGKLTQGAADASLVYASDVEAAGDRLEAIELPAELQPDVRYGIAVVEAAESPGAAREFVDGLRSGAGAHALEDAGFRLPARQAR